MGDAREVDEIRMPDDPARLVQHGQVDVLLALRTPHGDERVVLGGRTTTQHLRPNGAIIVVRPQFVAGRPPPLRRGDALKLGLRRSGESMEAPGVVSWVRPKAFLPSGLAVSLVGVTFEWDAEEMALPLAAFVAEPSLPPPDEGSH
jgi:hypothetical protein